MLQRRGFLSLGLASVSSLPALARPAPDPLRLGALEIEPGASPPGWNASGTNGEVVLRNAEAAGAVRFYWASRPSNAPNIHLAVTVALHAESSPESSAGLIFGYSEEARTYMAYTVEPRGTVALYRRGPNGFDRLVGMNGGRPDDPSRLEIQQSADGYQFAIGGRQVFSWSGRGAAGPHAGIIAMGIGRFGFRSFEFAARD